MGIFDSENNIQTIPLYLMLQKISNAFETFFGEHYLWFYETYNGSLKLMNQTNFENICDLCEDCINDIEQNLNEKYNDIQINLTSNESIPEQICDFLKSHLSIDPTRVVIETDKFFISLDNHINHTFDYIAEGYNIRWKVGQKYFDIPPQNIGYLHMIFNVNELNLHEYKKHVIHWFYPLAVVKNE